jgi:hypothetical protein
MRYTKYHQRSSQNNEAVVTIRGITLRVKYDYSPPEKQTYEEPGCDEDFDVWEIEPYDESDVEQMQAEEITLQDLNTEDFLAEIKIALSEQREEY